MTAQGKLSPTLIQVSRRSIDLFKRLLETTIIPQVCPCKGIMSTKAIATNSFNGNIDPECSSASELHS
jgi:hypothetical protein